MPARESAVVLSNRELSPGVWLMSLAAPRIAREASPGQFVQALAPAGGSDPLLRRPVSIHDRRAGAISLLIRRVGQGTALLSGQGKGTAVDLIGPLGRGFRPFRGRRPLLVAGGMGLAPMAFLARKLRSSGHRPRLLYGCRTRSELLSTPGLERMLATDDGSCGRRGTVTALLEDMLSKDSACSVFACGPWPMLKRTASVCLERGVPCQVSLEARMACGVGACQGCAVMASGGGYLNVCSDGPVFDAGEIDWGQEPPV